MDNPLSKALPKECDLFNEYFGLLQHCESKSVVDVGAGRGFAVAFYMAQGYDVTAVDNDAGNLRALTRNIVEAGYSGRLRSQVVDAADVQFDGNSAVIILSHILHFLTVEKAVALLDRAIRALAPDGLIFIRVHSNEHPMKDDRNYRMWFRHWFAPEEIESRFNDEFTLLHKAAIFARLPHAFPPEDKQFSMDFWHDLEYVYCRTAENDLKKRFQD